MCVLGACGMLSCSRAKGTPPNHWWNGWSDFDKIFFARFFSFLVGNRQKASKCCRIHGTNRYLTTFTIYVTRIVVDKQTHQSHQRERRAASASEKRVSQALTAVGTAAVHTNARHTILCLTFFTEFNTRSLWMGRTGPIVCASACVCGKGLTMSRHSFGPKESDGHIKSTQTHARTHKTKYFNNKKNMGLNK